MALGWILAAAGAVLAPEISHGASFGAFDILSKYGLLQQHGVTIHNPQAGDQIDAILPWFTSAWNQVHHGQIPLWNPYAALGTPLAFNWQTGAFSLQSAIAYAFPVNWAYTVQVAATLAIAGTGAYVFGRVLRLGILGCVFAATAFELSGPIIGWLGWPHSGVAAFAGWLFAATLLIVRGRNPARDIAFFALVVALTVYAGQPEILILVALALLAFAAVVLSSRALWDRGPIARPAGHLAIGIAAGGFLSAPLLLPGLQDISGSLRNLASEDKALPLHDLTHLVSSSFDGLPTAGSALVAPFYSETAAVVGVVVVVLAVLALARRTRLEGVPGLAATALVTAAIVFVPTVTSLIDGLPSLGHIAWHRVLLMLAFALAMLGGVGIDTLAREPWKRATRNWLLGGFSAMALILAGLWIFGRGQLPPAAASFRARSFVWPAVETAAGLSVVVLLYLIAPRRHKKTARGLVGQGRSNRVARIGSWAGAFLLFCETGFLIASGAPLWTSSPDFFSTPAAVASLQKAVGTSLVGFGVDGCLLPPGLGVEPNDNDVYALDELAVYDPALTKQYFNAWRHVAHEAPGYRRFYIFCPDIKSAALARLYGVSFVLEHPADPGPTGSVFDEKVGNEDLYRIPGAARATLSALESGGGLPPTEAPGTPVAMNQPDPGSWSIVTKTSAKEVLRLRITDVPGVTATIDGHPLALRTYAGVMLQAVVPPGTHTIRLRYWPSYFTVGLCLAAVAAAGLLIALGVTSFRRRRTRTTPVARPVEVSSEKVYEGVPS